MKSITHYIKESASKFLVTKKAAEKHDNAMREFNPRRTYQAILFLNDHNTVNYNLTVTGVEADAEEQTIHIALDESTQQLADVQRIMQRRNRCSELQIFYGGRNQCIKFKGLHKIEDNEDEFTYEYEYSIKL